MKNAKFVLIMGTVILMAIVGAFSYKRSAMAGSKRPQEKAGEAKADRGGERVVSDETAVPEHTIDYDEAAKRVEEIRGIGSNRRGAALRISIFIWGKWTNAWRRAARDMRRLELTGSCRMSMKMRKGISMTNMAVIVKVI